MKTGTRVRQRVPVIEGEVTQRRINPESDELELLVTFRDEAGEVHQRWFAQHELDEVQT